MAWMQDPAWPYLKYPHDKLLAEQARPYDSKKNVWIPDEEDGYVGAEIKAAKGDQIQVLSAKGVEVSVKKDLVQEMNPPKFEKSEDMSNLSFLNDASVLYNLRSRYSAMLIYTYSGLFCVVINPYKRLPIYAESVVRMYMGKRRTEMPPHLFAVADEAYRNMIRDREHQSMLITGESGAGKTENTKKVIAYFAVVGATQAGKDEEHGKKKATLEEQIVQTNPVLEAFGNAKTVRNNNSSRFGKFIRVHFDKTGKMAGGDIEHYLLEKSRVIKQNHGERCYHIFYQIMSGFIPDLRTKLLLDQEAKYYHFIAQAELTIEGVNDKEEHQLTDEAFDILGFTATEKLNTYQLCSGLMHMGEMKFKQRPREEQAEAEGVEEAQKACAMFGVDHEEYLKAITKPRVKVGTEWVNKGQNLEQVTWGIGAMAKGLFARLFHWLVKKCNETLSSKKDVQKEFFIGVLDIAGFEIFDTTPDLRNFQFNSFEQLWINFVNERLQQFFNHHMFVLEQEEYQREGIQWEFIDFGLDLAQCIELIEKPMGIIAMLDEECIVPKATDLTYAQKLNDQHLGKHPNFEKPKAPKGKQAEAHFAIKHYAGVVRYNVTAWLEKNKDPLNDTCVQVMKTQDKNALLLELWKDYTTQEDAAAAQKAGKESSKKKGKSAAFNTVSMLYRESLNNLMSMLHTTHPHFVRCIIPNELKKSGYIDAALVMNQLTCNGVLEGIRICRKGFPNRLYHADFKFRYSILAAAEAKSSPDPKVCADAIIKRMVFFKAGILAKMEDLRDERLSKLIVGLQAKVRWYVQLIENRRLREQKTGMIIITRNIRCWLELSDWSWFQLLGKVRPLMKAGELADLEYKIEELEAGIKRETKLRAELETNVVKIEQEKKEAFAQLSSLRDHLIDLNERADRMEQQKTKYEQTFNELTSELSRAEDKADSLSKVQKRLATDADQLKKKALDGDVLLRKSQAEAATKEHTIKTLKEEMVHQDELIAKVNKENKHLEEINTKMTDDLNLEIDKVAHMNKFKAKLEQSFVELEDAMEREKRNKQEVEKQKRKLDGEVRVAHEMADEISKQKQDIDNALRKKEHEMANMSARWEDTQTLVSKLQKVIKDLQARIQEFEEELNSEKQAHAKAETACADTRQELEDLTDRLDEAGGATSAHIEMNKKREAELTKLRRDLEEANLNHENQLGALRKKHTDAIAEMTEQHDQLNKQKAKLEKDKQSMQREIEEIQSAVDMESKAKQNADKLAKQLELQVQEMQAKVDDQSRQLNDFASAKARLVNENSDLNRQLEEAETQIGAMNRVKQGMLQQLEEAKHAVDEEIRERQALMGQIRQAQNDAESLRNSLDEETESKNDVLRQIAKASADVQQWQAKFETEGHSRAEELEDARRKLNIRMEELQGQLSESNGKIAILEKNRHRMSCELDDAQVEIERAHSTGAMLEKKQKGFNQVVEEWKHRCDESRADLDGSQRENRNLSTEVFKLRNGSDELHEQMESLRRENKQLQQEIKELSEQLSEGGRSVHEMHKNVRRLECEKEELHIALNEAEAALEAEESKVLRAQLEVNQIRAEIEKRIQEKEEEFENTRKNHQRALDSMQASIEGEAKSRAELLRVKKKLETDINDLEIALDHAHKANADAQKAAKRLMEQVKEIQMQLEDEQRYRDELREQSNLSEKRCSILSAEKEDLRAQLEQVERARRQAEQEAYSAHEHLNDVMGLHATLTAAKRKLEIETNTLHAELDEALAALKVSEEQSRKAMIEAGRLAEELHQEQEHATHIERMRKALETQVKEFQVRLDEAEQAALRGGKKQIQKLEVRARELESEHESEQRKHAAVSKTLQAGDRRTRELTFQVEEGKKTNERIQDLVLKLQQKIKTYRRQVEEAEEVAGTNLNKYRGLQRQLDDAQERADVAESALMKLKTKHRVVAGGGGGGLMKTMLA